MRLLIIQTGGTIDKDYPKMNNGYAFEIAEPAAARILENVAPGFEYDIHALLQKDSLDMTDKDRALIKAICEQADQSKIIITHGSDTMVATARFIGNIPGKTIVVTGAYRPERFINSDASFNLGVAIGAVGVLQEGTFVAMNGKLMDPATCKKDKKTGRFRSQ